jgi:hypothetical protein
MNINYLSVNWLYPPPAHGEHRWKWRLFSFTGIRRYPPKIYGGTNRWRSKGLTGIRLFAVNKEANLIWFENNVSENSKIPLTCYTVYRTLCFMTMIREIIVKRMKELKLNPNRLSEKLKGNVPRQTIYDFLTGKTDARTEVVSALMKVLDLEIKPIKKKNAG